MVLPISPVSTRDVGSLAAKGYTWWKAKRLLIIGQERSGKTRLFDYINSRILQKEIDAAPITTGEVKLWLRKMCFKQNGTETCVDLLNMTDQSGQSGPYIHAELVYKYKPQILFVVLDLSCPLHSKKPHEGSITWFNEFSKKLAERFRSSRSLVKRISSVTIMLNKMDTQSNDQKFREAELEIRKSIANLWLPFLFTKTDRIMIQPACTISIADGTDEATRENLDKMLINSINNALLRVN